MAIAEEAARKAVENKSPVLERSEAIQKSLELIDSCGVAILGSIGLGGYPNVKAVLKMETEGVKTAWFSTNTSSKRVQQFVHEPRACVYFLDEKNFKGLMLVGDMEVLSDPESRKRLWRDGFEVYYPLGIDDPDYTVLRFTAKWGNYYHGLMNTTFEI